MIFRPRTITKRTEDKNLFDENIRSLKDCQVALALGSCRSINLKIPRVGGIHEALKIAAFCQENDLLVWLGGMFESGVGRALNLQFASQPTFSFPGDISATERYFYEDIITEPFILEQGTMTVPQGLGIGVTLSQTNLLKYSQYQKSCNDNKIAPMTMQRSII